MKCNNCGAELNEEEKFCTVCGQPTNEGVSHSQDISAAKTEPEKKKFFGSKMKIAIAIVCILALGVAAAAKVVNVMKKSNMSDTEYYQSLEMKNRDRHAEALTDYYNSVYGGIAKGQQGRKINMKLAVSDTVKSLVSLYGIDISGVEEIELEKKKKKEGNTYSTIMKAGGNGQELITLKVQSDLDKQEGYVQIPELSKAYLHTSADAFNGEGNAILSAANYGKIVPEAEDLKKIYERYTGIVIENAKNVKKAEKQSDCKAEGVSQKADLYTVTMDGEEAVSLVGELLRQLKDDNEIKGIIKKVDEEQCAAYEEELADAIEDLEKNVDTEGFSGIMEVQVDSDERIIGRNIKIEDGTGEEVVIRTLYPRDGEKFACEAFVEVDGKEYFHLHGKGTEKSGVINGDLILDMALSETGKEPVLTKNVLMVTLEEYDISKLNKGEASGTMIYSTEALAELANYSLKVEMEGDQEEAKGTISILAGKEEFATIDMKIESDVDVDVDMPSDSDKVYEASDDGDMEAYQSEMDVLPLLKKVQDVFGIDFGSFAGNGMGSGF